MINKYHVHVYKVIGKIEIDIEAETEIIAKTKALKLVKKSKLNTFIKSDCNYIALAFEGE